MDTRTHDYSIKHRHISIDGVRIFYREAGAPDAPVVLLPHGYPSSSFQFRNFMPALADRWRLIAPDYPGFGYSDTPDEFSYTFDGYADLLDRFARALRLTKYVLYLHDYGSQIGLRLAIAAPERIAGLIIQNGDIYEDALGPKYETLKAYWAHPTAGGRRTLTEAVTEEGFRDEFVGEIEERLLDRIPPDLWTLSWSLMTDRRREIMVGLMEGLRENLSWFPRYQRYSICWTGDIGRSRQTSRRSSPSRVNSSNAYIPIGRRCRSGHERSAAPDRPLMIDALPASC